MDRKLLFALWGGMFSLCAGLGFIPEPEGAARAVLTALAVLSFLPPALLVYSASKAASRADLLLARNLAAASLILTAVLLALNFLTVLHSQALGDLLYGILVVVSSPMICGGNWAMSLFFWACLLTASMQQLKKHPGK